MSRSMKINRGGAVPPHFSALRLVLGSILFVVFNITSCAYAQQWDWAVYGELNKSFFSNNGSTPTYFDAVGNSYTVVYTGEESVRAAHTDGCDLDTYPSLGVDDLYRSYWQLVKRDIAGHEVWRSSKQLTSAIDDIMFQDSRILVSAYHYSGDVFYELNGVRYNSSLANSRFHQKIVLEFNNLGNLVSHYPLHGASRSQDVFPINDDFLVLHFNKDSGRIVLPDTTMVAANATDSYGLHRVTKTGVVKWSNFFNWPFTGFGTSVYNQRVTSSESYVFYLHQDTFDTRLYKMDLNGSLLDSIDLDANVNRVVVDSKGSLTLTGTFWGDFSFQGHQISATSTASPFVLKLTENMDYVWHYNLSKNDSFTSVEYVKVNVDNQIMVSAYYPKGITLTGGLLSLSKYAFFQLDDDGSYIDHQVLDVAVGDFQPLSISDFAFVNNKDVYIAYDRVIPISSGLKTTNIVGRGGVIAKLNYQEFELIQKEISCKKDSLELAADRAFIKLEWLIDNKIYMGKRIRPVVDTSGLYLVQIKAYLNDSVYRSRCDTVRIRVVPIVGFDVSDTIVCAFQSITFTDESISQDTHSVNGLKWVWTFGDGETKTVLSPESKSPVSHSYTTPGSYTVSLFYSNGFCDSTLTKNQYIKVVDAPAPGFTVDNIRGCSPFTVNVTDTVTKNTIRKEYNYYDGRGWIDVPVNQANFSQTYPDAGTYWITQRLYGYTGCVTQLDSVQVFVTPGFTAFDTLHITNATYQDIPAHPKAKEIVTLTWPCLEDAAVRYDIYRNAQKIESIVADSVTCVYGNLYYDDSLVNAKTPNTYTVLALDSCGTATQLGRVGQPVHLTGEVVGNNELSIIRYTAYQDWNVGAAELGYDLQTEAVLGDWKTLKQENSTADYRDYQFLDATKAGIQLEKCYRVIARLGGSKSTISNILCLPYSPVIFIPTAFSPNGDNLNEVYRPITFGITQYTMSIYDRYGQKVAELNQDSAGWDAADYPIGTYMVTLRAKGTDSKWYNAKETVTVVR